jgi:cytochrome c biogenesis protein CcmG/thiol:disulfide interchange protein DsbE
MSTNTSGKKRSRSILIAGAAIVLYIAAGSALRNSAGSDGSATPFTAAAARRPFTPLQGNTIPDERPWKLAALRGKIVLINYVATWCAPCRRETPDLVAAANRYRDKGFEVVGLMMDEGSSSAVNAAVNQYAQQYDISYPLVRPAADPLLQFSGLGLPTSILLDRQGRQVRTYLGPVSLSTLTADIERVLRENNSPPMLIAEPKS